MKTTFKISSKSNVKVFQSAIGREIIQALIGEEMTLSDLAIKTSLSLSLLHYHITKYTKEGLIEVVKTRKRAGRSVKYYRSVAKSFFIPAELLDALPGSYFNSILRKRLEESLSKSLIGIDFTHDGQKPRAHLIKDKEDNFSAIELWLHAGLSSADAQSMAEKLQKTIDEFRTFDNPDAPRHLIHFAAVRL